MAAGLFILMAFKPNIMKNHGFDSCLGSFNILFAITFSFGAGY
jgi:hypothetical protein